MTNLSNAWPGTDEVGDTGEMGAPLLAADAQRPQSAAAVLKIANIVLGSNIIPYVLSCSTAWRCVRAGAAFPLF
jgi:hypothetical protein